MVPDARRAIKPSVWDVQYRAQLSWPLYRVCIEVFCFSIAGLLLGFALALLLPPFDVDEPWYLSLVYLLLALLVNAIVIYAIGTAYVLVLRGDANAYLGLTMFNVVLLNAQPALVLRMRNLFTLATQAEVNTNVAIVHPRKRAAPAGPPAPAPNGLPDRYVFPSPAADSPAA